MKKIKYILFDWDGTLAQTYDVIRHAHEDIHARLNMPVPDGEEWYRQYFGRNREGIYQSLYGDRAELGQEYLLEFLRERHLDFVVPYDCALQSLKALHELGVIMAVITNKFRALTEPEIHKFEASKYFASVVCAGDAAADKPSGVPIDFALLQLGYQGDRSDVLMVGDTRADILAAKEAGVASVFIQHDMPDYSAEEDAQPDYKVQNCNDLLSLVNFLP